MSFKWKNRKKATERAIELKKEGLSAEDAVKRVLDEYEGVYFENGSEITEVRHNNFIKRVEEEKKYKKSTPKTINLDLKHEKVIEHVKSGDLTELQAKILDAILENLEGFNVEESGVEIESLVKESEYKPLQIKNAIRQLEKKGYVLVRKLEDEDSDFVFVELDKKDLLNSNEDKLEKSAK